MKLAGLAYDVLAELELTKAEVDLMIKYAKAHYDRVCQLAGCMIDEHGAKTNGFIAQLHMRARHRTARQPYASVTWSFRELDTALKVLERRDDPRVRKLFTDLQSSCNALYHRHNELKKEEQTKCQKDR